MNKSELRKILRERQLRFALAEQARGVREALELTIAERLLDHLRGTRIVAAYLSNGREVDPLPALEAFAAGGMETALPHVIAREAGMRFLRWAPGDPLVAGPFGLLQPAADALEIEPDLILTPLVGFDRAMRRLGQGAAFYDRAFARLPGARRIGLAWSVQEAEELPTDAWDVPLHAVATEKEWIEPDA